MSAFWLMNTFPRSHMEHLNVTILFNSIPWGGRSEAKAVGLNTAKQE